MVATSVENLDLSSNSISDAAANVLSNTLANGIHLKVLKLADNVDITTEGWRAICEGLSSPRCVLQELYINGNESFGDELVAYLSNSLARNSTMRYLDLRYAPTVTASGWRAFSAIFQNPVSALETVNLVINSSIDDGVLGAFANALMRNSKLKELFLVFDEEDITTRNWDALSNVLCKKLSIEETFNSNHTLEMIFDPYNNDGIDESQLPSNLRTLLQLNRENTKSEAARRKILNVHFSGNFNMQPFIDMDLKVLPDAISWMARNEHGISLLYQFVRNTTFFLDLGGQ